MAADCVTRVWALAIATAACIGLPSALVYAIVRVAAARRYSATFALGLVLVFWVIVSAAYYPRVCADLLVPALRFRRHARRLRGHGDGEPSLLVSQRSSFVTTDVFPRQAPQAPAARGGARAVRAGDVSSSAPSTYPFAHQRVPLAQRYEDRGGGMMGAYNGYRGAAGASSSRMMAALPREPPAARGKARVGAGDDGVVPRPPPCEEQSDGGPSKYCPICMTDVDEEETAKRLPLCLHVFHRQCIDQWLQLGAWDTRRAPLAGATPSCLTLGLLGPLA